MNIERLKEEIKSIQEPRRTRYGNVRHKLEDIIIIGLCTLICGGEDFADMEAFGKSRQKYLAKFLELPNILVHKVCHRSIKIDLQRKIVERENLCIPCLNLFKYGSVT